MLCSHNPTMDGKTKTLYGFWKADSGTEKVLNFIRAAQQVLSPFALGSYVNYPTYVAQSAERYFGESLPRLRTIKAKYDPFNLFRSPISVKPAQISATF